MSLPLVVTLVVHLVAFPAYPAIHVQRYATEAECVKAAYALGATTKVRLRWSCTTVQI